MDPLLAKSRFLLQRQHLNTLGKQTLSMLGYNQNGDKRKPLLLIDQLRKTPSGDLLASTNDRSKARRLAPFVWSVTAGNEWPAETLGTRDCQINVGANGIHVPDRGDQDMSDNTWSIGDKRLQTIVDFSFDSDALWVVTKQNGIFRIGVPRQESPQAIHHSNSTGNTWIRESQIFMKSVI